VSLGCIGGGVTPVAYVSRPQDRDQGARPVGGRSVGRPDPSIREGFEGERAALFPKRHCHSRPPSSQYGAVKTATLSRQRPRRKLGSWGLGCCPTTRPTWRREDLRCSVARMETFLPTKKLEFLIVLGADRWSSSLKIARVTLFR